MTPIIMRWRMSRRSSEGRVVDVYDLGQQVKEDTSPSSAGGELGMAQSAYLGAKLYVAERSYERAKMLLAEKVIGLAEAFQRRKELLTSAQASAKPGSPGLRDVRR
ncbi:MAG: hypothetical protein U0361_20495 [Nitrospiraceae bacterium]